MCNAENRLAFGWNRLCLYASVIETLLLTVFFFVAISISSTTVTINTIFYIWVKDERHFISHQQSQKLSKRKKNGLTTSASKQKQNYFAPSSEHLIASMCIVVTTLYVSVLPRSLTCAVSPQL